MASAALARLSNEDQQDQSGRPLVMGEAWALGSLCLSGSAKSWPVADGHDVLLDVGIEGAFVAGSFLRDIRRKTSKWTWTGTFWWFAAQRSQACAFCNIPELDAREALAQSIGILDFYKDAYQPALSLEGSLATTGAKHRNLSPESREITMGIAALWQM